MVAFIRDWVLNIVTLVLFIVLIEMLVPSGKMKKYIGLVTGIVLIIAIITPFLKVIGGKVDLVEMQAANSSFLDRLEIERDSKVLEDQQLKQIVEVYRKKLISQIEASAAKTEGVAGVKADVIINEDYGSEHFGEVRRVYLEISPKGDDSTIKPVNRVEKVVVGEGGAGPKGGKGQAVFPAETKPAPALSRGLEDRMQALLGIDRENVVISLQK